TSLQKSNRLDGCATQVPLPLCRPPGPPLPSARTDSARALGRERFTRVRRPSALPVRARAPIRGPCAPTCYVCHL
ncbi:hypothetical protein HWV62_9817, partial [Athelia sp. TMB]